MITRSSQNENKINRAVRSLDRIRFIFVDRDGVVNRKMPEGQFVTRPEHIELLPGAAGAIAELNRRGVKVILVTNQRAIGLGILSAFELEQLHVDLGVLLAREGARIDGVYFCPHDPARQKCRCRKPETGMFEQAMTDFAGISRETALMIGDSLSDIQAGSRMGMYTIYVKGDKANRKPGGEEAARVADTSVNSLQEAIETVLPFVAR